MTKKTKAVLGALAFVAGCEIGLAIQLYKMIKDYVIKEEAINTDPGLDEIQDDEDLEES